MSLVAHRSSQLECWSLHELCPSPRTSSSFVVVCSQYTEMLEGNIVSPHKFVRVSVNSCTFLCVVRIFVNTIVFSDRDALPILSELHIGR